MPAERLDQVALDDRPVGADDAPRHDVGVGAGLVDEPGDEGAVTGQRVDAAVERADLVEPLLRVGRVVDVADRPAVEPGPGLTTPTSQSCLPQPVSSVATTGRRPTISSSGRRIGRGTGVHHRLAATAAGHAVGRARRPSPSPDGLAWWKGLGLVERDGLVERVGVDAAHQHDVVEADAAHRLDAVRRPGVLQQHPAVGRDRGLLVLDRRGRAARRRAPTSRASAQAALLVVDVDRRLPAERVSATDCSRWITSAVSGVRETISRGPT